MMNLRKYRQFVMVTFLVIMVAAFLTFASVWNSILTARDIKYEGWIIVFLSLLTIASIVLFYFSFKLSDQTAFQDHVNDLVSAEKEKLAKKMEDIEMQETELLTEENITNERISEIYAGLQSVKTIDSFAGKVLMNISKQIEIVRGVFFYKGEKEEEFTCRGEYALTGNKPVSFKTGENLTGQTAKNRTLTSIHEIPDDYFRIESGLGGARPKHLFLVPLVYKNETLAVIELATFKKIDAVQVKILNTLISELGERLNKFVSAKL
jgi:hypothetical protein